jgi:hypothetical protein
MNRKRALAIASHLGMPWRHTTKADLVTCLCTAFRPMAYLHAWNGKLLLVSPRRSGADLLHEIGHWLTVSKQMRRLPEYGLGRAPWDDICDCETRGEGLRMDPLKKAQEDAVTSTNYEHAACWTEFAIREACGGNWRKRARELSFDPPRHCSFREWMKSVWNSEDSDLVPYREKCVSVAFTRELAAIRP